MYKLLNLFSISSIDDTRINNRQQVIVKTLLFMSVFFLLIAISSTMFSPFLMNNLIRAFIYAVIAITVDMLWGFTGILTYGQSAYFGIGAYVAGLYLFHFGFSPLNAMIAFILALVISWLVSRFISWLSFYYGAPPIYSSIVSLVFPIVLVQLIYLGGDFTGSSSGLSGFDSFDLSLEQWYIITGVFLTLVFFIIYMVIKSDVGKVLIAIRENSLRCEYLGINVIKIKTKLSSVTSMIACMAGFLFACVQMVIAPEYADFIFGTQLVIWVALGGRGTLIGPALGTILIDISSGYLSGDLPYLWQLIIGGIFVIVILIAPKGIMPILVKFCCNKKSIEQKQNNQYELIEADIKYANTGQDMLNLDEVCKNFGNLNVLTGITFSVRTGELVSIIGPNGAGKTTLMKCISDGNECSSGNVIIKGINHKNLEPYKCVGLGISRKFQTALTYDSLTVFESLRIARTRIDRTNVISNSYRLTLPKPALDIIYTTGLDKVLHTECQYLSHGQKQALELAMVLSIEPQIVLLDEPTAGLTKSERTLIGNIFVELSQKYGLCLLLVEHDLEFVKAISSRIVVMHQGKIVMDGSVDEVVNSEIVKNIYAGHN